MDKIRIIDLEYKEKAQAGSTGKPSKKLGFKEKARRGHYGDLRLLGLSAGLVLLIILVGLLQSGDASMVTANTTALNETAVTAPPVFAATADETPTTAASAIDEFVYSGMDLDDSLAVNPDERTHEQREQLRREMAENIPEGETLVW